MNNQNQDDIDEQNRAAKLVIAMSHAPDSKLLGNIKAGGTVLYNHPTLKHEWHNNLSLSERRTIFARLVFYSASNFVQNGVPIDAKALNNIGNNVFVYYFPCFERAVAVAVVGGYQVVLNCWKYDSTDDGSTKLPFDELLVVSNRYKALYA